MTKRKKTPSEIETNVLTMSARRCCICFGVQMDMSVKKGQIAHLDHDPSNNDFDNLAYLCSPHHDDYDSKTSQSKGLTIHEVKAYRTLLYEAVKQMRNDLSPAVTKQANKRTETDGISAEISGLLSKVQSRNVSLSQCFVEGVALAQKLRDSEFEKFCRNELSGYTDPSISPPDYRTIDIFVGIARINMRSPSWGEDPNNVFEYMKQDTENFIPYRICIAHSISSIESHVQNANFPRGIVLFTIKIGDINPKASNPNIEIPAYTHPAKYQGIFEAVRRELTVRLLNLLPNLDG